MIVCVGILEALHCILTESPEALNIIQKDHIRSIISLLYKHGRNHKVSIWSRFTTHRATQRNLLVLEEPLINDEYVKMLQNWFNFCFLQHWKKRHKAT